jgi:hypothetical protein
MAANGTLSSHKRFNNKQDWPLGFHSAGTIGFQQQTNKLYLVGVSAPNEWSERK